MAGVVHIPWYATVFRGDQLEEALGHIAPLALRFGATDYRVYRSRDDSYKFLHLSTFEEKEDWERFWYGPDFSAWRAEFASFYQVPIVYVWNDLVLSGSMPEAPTATHGAPAEGDTV
jgi:quinol monooxygenase YgiN